MPSDPPAVYWDACVFIARIRREPGRIDLLEELTDLAVNGGLLIVTSTIVRAEVIKGADLTQTTDEQLEQILEFFENPGIEVRQFNWFLSGDAARLRKKHGLDTVDAIHLATALEHDAITEMHTYDGDLLDLNEKVGNPPLRIIPPKHPIPTPLFDKTE